MTISIRRHPRTCFAFAPLLGPILLGAAGILVGCGGPSEKPVGDDSRPVATATDEGQAKPRPSANANGNANAAVNAGTNANARENSPPANAGAGANANTNPPANADADPATNADADPATNANTNPPANANPNPATNSNANTNTNANANANSNPPENRPPANAGTESGTAGGNQQPPPAVEFPPITETPEQDKADRLALIEKFRAFPKVSDRDERHTLATQFMQAFDDLQGTAEWDELRSILTAQADARAGEPLFAFVYGFFLARDHGNGADDFAKGWEVLQAVTETTPDFAWPFMQMATRAVLDGEYQKGLELVDKALAVRGEFLDARRLRTLILLDLGKNAEAKQFVEETLKLAPETITPELHALAKVGDKARMRELIAPAAAITADSRAQGHLMLAILETEEGNGATAREEFKAAIRTIAAAEPKNFWERRHLRETLFTAYLNYATHLAAREPRDLPRAMKICEIMLAYEPTHPDALGLYCELVKMLDDIPRAHRALELLGNFADTPEAAWLVLPRAVQTAQFIVIKGNGEKPNRAVVWRLLAMGVRSYPTLEMPEDRRQFIFDVLKVMCPTGTDRTLDLPRPLEAVNFEGVAQSDIETVMDWLRVQSQSEEFRVRLPAMDFMPLIARATGLRKDRLVALATEVLQAPVGSKADSTKAAWARALAILGEKQHAAAIVAAMDAFVAAGDERAAQGVFQLFHSALRALLDPDFRSTFKSRRASMTEMQRLAEDWRAKLP